MIPLPNRNYPFVSKLGAIASAWASYLQQFTQQPPNFINITVGISPFSYEAAEPGNLSITGGTIINIRLTRGTVNIDYGSGTNKIIPLAIRDIVTVTYSVLPAINFIPSYGQAPA